jgi:hypothetical protein
MIEEKAEVVDIANPSEAGTTITPVFNKEGLKKLSVYLTNKFRVYEADRRVAEKRWAQNARQKAGIYDPSIRKHIGENRSDAYPKITRVKCVSMVSRLMNLLFQASEANWTVMPSDVPDLHQEDLQEVLDSLSSSGEPLDNETIEEAIRKFAAKRGLNLAREISDQLQDLGGSRSLSYPSLARKVLVSGIDYGMGVLKGPFVETKKRRTWTADLNGRLMAVEKEVFRPRYEFVKLWDYYPDMSAKSLDQMEGQFERGVMVKHELIKLKRRADFISDAIDEVLEKLRDGNYSRREFEADMTQHGDQKNVATDGRGKYEVIIWDGALSGRVLKQAGIDVPDDRLQEDLQAHVWMIDGIVIKARTNPWSDLLDNNTVMKMYHHFIFEDDETSIFGQGLPNIVRDSQLGICAAVRMILDNASIMRNLEINTELLRPDQDMLAIESDKIWYREDDGPTANVPAVRSIDLPMHLPELQAIVQMFKEFSDQETFVGAATGGDMQNGPSEPFRTAAGASMLHGQAALPFKDVVRNFDIFTESLMGSLIVFNRVFSDDKEIRGDFLPKARGATSLIAKEVLGMQLDNLATTLTEDEKRYVDFRQLAIARVRARDLDDKDIIVSDAEARKIDQAMAQEQQTIKDREAEMVRAEIREVLAKALKDVSLSVKHNAAAEAQEAKTVLDALEVGINATEKSIAGEPPAGPDQDVEGGNGRGFSDQAAEFAPGETENQTGAVSGGSVFGGASQGTGNSGFDSGLQ